MGETAPPQPPTTHTVVTSSHDCAARRREGGQQDTYDASDNRVLKSATAKENNVDTQRHSVYISGGQELRGAKFAPDYLDSGATGADYQIDSKTEIAYLFAHGVRLGRVAYDNGTGMPAYTANAVVPAQHVLINLDDTLGSTAIVIDKATGELVEASSYLAHGATESDYRPERWNGLREDYRFTGKEEDVEVGLQYFGKRFLSPYLNRWVSADPLAVQQVGKGDWNLYAYVSGTILKNVDPLGLETSNIPRIGNTVQYDPISGEAVAVNDVPIRRTNSSNFFDADTGGSRPGTTHEVVRDPMTGKDVLADFKDTTYQCTLEQTKVDVEKSYAKAAGQPAHNNTDPILVISKPSGAAAGPGFTTEKAAVYDLKTMDRIADVTLNKVVLEFGGVGVKLGVSVGVYSGMNQYLNSNDLSLSVDFAGVAVATDSKGKAVGGSFTLSVLPDVIPFAVGTSANKDSPVVTYSRIDNATQANESNSSQNGTGAPDQSQTGDSK